MDEGLSAESFLFLALPRRLHKGYSLEKGLGAGKSLPGVTDLGLNPGPVFTGLCGSGQVN